MRAIDSSEYTSWVAYDELEPIEDQAWQAASIAATIANVNRPKGRKAYQPSDFMAGASPDDYLTPAQRQALLQERINALMFAAGGRVKGQESPKPGGRRQAKSRKKGS